MRATRLAYQSLLGHQLHQLTGVGVAATLRLVQCLVPIGRDAPAPRPQDPQDIQLSPVQVTESCCTREQSRRGRDGTGPGDWVTP